MQRGTERNEPATGSKETVHDREIERKRESEVEKKERTKGNRH